jgi:hypothetical protein
MSRGQSHSGNGRGIVVLDKGVVRGMVSVGSEIRVPKQYAPQGGFVAQIGDSRYEAHTVRIDHGRDSVTVKLDRPYQPS